MPDSVSAVAAAAISGAAVLIAILRYGTPAILAIYFEHKGKAIRVSSNITGLCIDTSPDQASSVKDSRISSIPAFQAQPQKQHAEPAGEQPDDKPFVRAAVPLLADRKAEKHRSADEDGEDDE